MADQGDAEVLQIVGGQRRQDGGINLVLAKRLGIALEPEFTQPGLNIEKLVLHWHESVCAAAG